MAKKPWGVVDLCVPCGFAHAVDDHGNPAAGPPLEAWGLSPEDLAAAKAARDAYIRKRGGIPACEKHGPSGMSVNYKGEPVVHCAHCTAEFDAAAEGRISAMVQTCEMAMESMVLHRIIGNEEHAVEARRAFGNALRDLVKEARRR